MRYKERLRLIAEVPRSHEPWSQQRAIPSPCATPRAARAWCNNSDVMNAV